jgi:exopolysaccharide production protein ExoQ
MTPASRRVMVLPPQALTAAAFVVSLTGMLLVGYVGSVGAVVFLVPWVLLGLAYARASLHLLARGPVLVWLVPCFALLSTLWSQAHAETLRLSVEDIVTYGCAVLSALLLQPRALLVMMTISLIIISAVSVALGHQTVDPLSGAMTFVGVFASKNQLGFFSSLMFLGALALILDSRQPIRWRLLGCAAVPASLPLIVLSRSATSLASVIVALGVFVLGLPLSRLSRFGRARWLFAALVILLLGALPLLVARAAAGEFFLNLLGKDATLTGRTDLWRYAATIIPDHPVLGYGFQAFWLHDSVDAESLWAAFRVASRTGFHFHNTYIETTVELGYVGATMLAVTIFAILVGSIRWSWQARSVPAAFFVALMCCLIIRSFAEVDALPPLQIGTFILCVAGTFAATKPDDPVT